MQFNQKLPIGISEISKMMGVSKEELRVFPHFATVRESFKDYNFGVLSKKALINKLSTIKPSDDYYLNSINNVISVIEACY